MTLEEMQERFPIGSKVKGRYDNCDAFRYYVIGYLPYNDRVLCAHVNEYNGDHNLIEYFTDYLMIKEGVEASGIPLNRHSSPLYVETIIMVERAKPKIDWVEI